MAKFFTILLLISLTTSKSRAVDVGVLGGYGITNAEDSTNTTEWVSEDKSYRFGLAIRTEINEYFAFRTGFLYVARHYQLNGFDPIFFGQYKYDAELKYLDVPLLVQLNIFSWLGLYAGPIVALNVSGRNEGDIAGIDFDVKINGRNSPYLMAQAGLHFDMGRVGLDLFYEQGFSEIYDGGESDLTVIGINLTFWLTTSNEAPSELRRSNNRKVR